MGGYKTTMSCDPESKALWDELRKTEFVAPRGGSDCCLLISWLIRSGYRRITVGSYSVLLTYCPNCGKKI